MKTWFSCTKRKRYEEIKTFIKGICTTAPGSDQGVTLLEVLMQAHCVIRSCVQPRMLCHSGTGGRYLTPQPHLSSILGSKGLVIQEADVTEADLGVQVRQGTKGLSLLRNGERVPGI